MSSLAERWARERPDAPALICADRSWSWRALHESSARWKGAVHRLGLRPGDRLGVVSGNAAEVALLIHGAVRAGVSLALLNARLAPAEWRDQLERARCRAVVLGPGIEAPELGVPMHRLDALPLDGPEVLDADPDPERPLALLYTSGTTGRPKAARLTAEALQAHARASAALLGSTPDDLHLCNLPLFHVGGLSMLFRAAECGGAVLLHERFDPHRVLHDLSARPVTHLSLVASTLARLLDSLGAAPWRAPALRVLLLGGGPLPEPLRLRAEKLRLPLLATYGLTEACSQVCTVPPREREVAAGTSGRPLPGFQVRIVDAARNPVPAGVAGEIEVCAPSLMQGYDGDPEATATALADGWLRTRDLGTLDARGLLTVHARRSDLILSGGENVYPAEVEAALLAIPGVRDAAVVGRADATWGQVPVAGLVLAPGTSTGDVAAALQGRLARYKQPRELVVLPELPRTASGKVERPKLLALVEQSLTPRTAG